MTYFGTRLTNNLSRREPEGYLICLNVPVARTGIQEYLPSELGLPEPDSRLIPVLRPEEEVFAPACLASFEGMPVTDDHPSDPEGVTAENSRELQKGHAHNVRRGAPPEDDLLLADLMITDPALIEEILAGKREISCGYTYSLAEENGRYVQRDIRGNHIAVVTAGRAGARVAIRDADLSKSPIWVTDPMLQPPMNQAQWAKMSGQRRSHKSPMHLTTERSNAVMKNRKLARVLARMARDGETEEVAEILEEILDPAAASLAPEGGESGPLPGMPALAAAVPEAPVVVEAPENQPVLVDCGPEILEALNRIVSLLSAPAAAEEAGAMPSADEGSEAAGAEPLTDPAAEAVAQAAAGTLAEAVAEAAEAALPGGDAEEDPVDALVAEILETGAGDESAEEAESVSGLLEPETDEDPEDPEIRTGDALRAALSVFRPQLRRMSPQARRRFNADVAARMRSLNRPAPGARSAYAALCPAAARDRSAQSLGQRIMASRNANLRA